MTLPRSPAFPIVESIETGTAFPDTAHGAVVPVPAPAVDDERTLTVEFPKLNREQVARLRWLYRNRKTVAYWPFNRAIVDRGADNWVQVRFAEPLRTRWTNGNHYRVRVVLHQRVGAGP